MNESKTRMSVCAQIPHAWVKIEGRADCHFSPAFKALVYGLRQKNCSTFLLEFTHCTLIDSTFAGTLLGLAREFGQTRHEGSAPCLALVNINQRVADTLDNLGVLGLFRLLRLPAPDATKFEPAEVCTAKSDRKVLNQSMLVAHTLLAEINPANFEKFKDVIKYLEEDLKKQDEPA